MMRAGGWTQFPELSSLRAACSTHQPSDIIHAASPSPREGGTARRARQYFCSQWDLDPSRYLFLKSIFEKIDYITEIIKSATTSKNEGQ